jgi:hypothetical protein
MTLSEQGIYEMIHHPNDDKAWAIDIRKGEFKGIVYAYGRVQIIEDEQKQNATMKFEVDILNIPDYIKDKPFTEEHEEKFHELAHKILCEELESYFTDKEKYDSLVASGVEPVKTEFDFDE